MVSHHLIAQQTEKWGDQGDGTYRNPILPSDYSDIDAIRVGSDYYAISSTFQYSPGMVILHSKDLVNWEILSHVVNDITLIGREFNWDKMNRYGKGIWAGAIRYYNNKFWVYFFTPDEGLFMSSSTNAAGPWQPLYKMWDTKGWDDCCPFWDDDGQGYLIATNYADKYKIHLFKMDAVGKQLIMSSDSVIHQSRGSEANKLYKINGLYYHYYSEVKSEGRVPMMGRSKCIYGPYENKQIFHVNKPKDKEPNQGGLIQNAAGDWWFFTHQGTGTWEGRAACLLPVTWVDGWPIIGEVGKDTIGNMIWQFKKPISIKTNFAIQTNEEFNQPVLPVQWEWNYQPKKDKFSLTDHKGFLRLHAFKPNDSNTSNDKRKTFYRAGNTLTQRCIRTLKNEVVIKLETYGMANGQLAGLCHYSSTYSTFGIKEINGIKSLFYDNNGTEKIGPEITSSIWLQSTWGYDGISQYAYSLDGKIFIPFGSTYQLTWGFYRGDRIGIYSYNATDEKGFVDIDFFHFSYSK
ncbi:MAG: glycoside hydrolase 43 family protein [Pedobacter sp.]|nr:glycoside hydrolase 43 family protein [Chitinophagaceae bacterium]